MSRFLLNCTYCGHQWAVQYLPVRNANCVKCHDKNLTVKDLSKDKIDYYAGTTPYKEEEKTKEIVLQEPKETEEETKEDPEDSYPYLHGSWD